MLLGVAHVLVTLHLAIVIKYMWDCPGQPPASVGARSAAHLFIGENDYRQIISLLQELHWWSAFFKIQYRVLINTYKGAWVWRSSKLLSRICLPKAVWLGRFPLPPWVWKVGARASWKQDFFAMAPYLWSSLSSKIRMSYCYAGLLKHNSSAESLEKYLILSWVSRNLPRNSDAGNIMLFLMFLLLLLLYFNILLYWNCLEPKTEAAYKSYWINNIYSCMTTLAPQQSKLEPFLQNHLKSPSWYRAVTKVGEFPSFTLILSQG